MTKEEHLVLVRPPRAAMHFALLAAAAVLLLGSCVLDDSEDPVESPDVRTLYAIDLAVNLVENQESSRAATVFRDAVHQGIHDLAARVSKHDRAAAADLLEAKQEVEAELENPNPDLGPPLAHLYAATCVAIKAMGDTQQGCQ